jgi:ATP-dependent Clp protease ATP-binding subunit ClpC
VPPGDRPESRLAQAVETLARNDGELPGIVRRYREQPSPLVRDAARNWRSGLVGRILEGDFDLIV